MTGTMSLPVPPKLPKRRDDQRHDPWIVEVVVRPVDRRRARVGAAEDALLQPALDLADCAARLRLDALPRLGQRPELVVGGAGERRVDLVSRAAALLDLVGEIRDSRGRSRRSGSGSARDAELDDRIARERLHLQAAGDREADPERRRRPRLERVAAGRGDAALEDLHASQRARAAACDECALHRTERPRTPCTGCCSVVAILAAPGARRLLPRPVQLTMCGPLPENGSPLLAVQVTSPAVPPGVSGNVPAPSTLADDFGGQTPAPVSGCVGPRSISAWMPALQSPAAKYASGSARAREAARRCGPTERCAVLQPRMCTTPSVWRRVS